MATEVKHRRGTAAELSGFTPALAELVMNTDDNTLVVGDGATPGGHNVSGYNLNVRRFGAKGDGVTDDSTAVASAIDKAMSTGLSLFFPGGTYLIDSWVKKSITAPLVLTGENATVKASGLTTTVFSLLSDLCCDGVEWLNFSTVFEIGALSSPIDVVISNCKNKNSIYFVNRPNANINDIGVSGFFFFNNTVDHSAVSDGTFTRAVRLTGRYESAKVYNNVFQDINGTAVQLGDNTYSRQDEMNDSLVIGNTFHHLIEPSTSECHAVIVYGRDSRIVNNYIDDVQTSDGNDVEGIYTKCRWAIISNNTLVDAGQSEGAIAIKGNKRSDTDNPQGFSTLCHSNIVRFTSSVASDGIFIQNDDVKVFNNLIEGAGRYGIYTQSDEYNDISITNNTVRNHNGFIGIFSQHFGKRTRIQDNEITGLIATGVANAFGIEVISSNGQIDDLDVSRNKITIGDECVATSSCRGITLFRNNNVMNHVTVSQNDVNVVHSSITEYGIQLSGTTVGDDWKIEGNDVSRTTINKLVHSNDTPTNMVVRGNHDGDSVSTGTSPTVLESGKTITNQGATGLRTVSLPGASPGLKFTVIRTVDQTFRASPDGTDVIRGGGSGKYLELDTLGDSVVLECVTNGSWEITGGNGSYSYEP